jgi:hypothetical protein
VWLLERMPRIRRANGGEDGPRLLDYLVLGPLRWLGLVEATSRMQEIRVSGAGLNLLRGQAPAQRGGRQPIELGASGRVVLHAEHGVINLWPLLPYLGRRGAAEWELSRESFLDGLQRGGASAAALAALRAVGDPGDWTATLAGWEREARGGRLVSAVMLDLTEHPAAERVLADGRVAPYLLGVLGSALAVVHPEEEQSLVVGLRALGVLVERLPGEARVPKHPGARLSEADLAMALALAERSGTSGPPGGAGSADLAAKLRPLVSERALVSARARLRARKGGHRGSRAAR